MCVQKVRKYSCGCVKSEEFIQCGQRAGSNVQCVKPTKEELPASAHYCRNHMHTVKAGTPDPMYRPGNAPA
jgi:hypothetical protein